MAEIALPSGATVTLRDPKTFKQKDRRKVYESISGEATVSAGIGMQDTLIALMVEDWSLDLIIPSIKIESLGELDIPDYDRLSEVAEDAMKVLFPKFNEQSDDPKALADN